MTEYVQDRRRQRRAGEDRQDTTPDRDLRNQELDEDVACCLAEIDELLDREQAERDQARAEFEKFVLAVRGTPERELKIWQAKYAHLGLSYGWCCGSPYLIDPKDKT